MYVATFRFYKKILIFFIFAAALGAAGSVCLTAKDDRPDLIFSAFVFSPEHTGPYDKVIITPGRNLRKAGELQDWMIEIKDASGNTVRTFRADKRKYAVSLSGSNRYAPDSYKAAPLEIFRELIWDGRSDKGEFVVSGDYTAGGWYVKKNSNSVMLIRESSVRVIKSQFVASLIPERTRISLLKDRDSSIEGDQPAPVLLRNETAEAWQYNYTGTIYDESRRIIKKIKYKDFPGFLEWDGKSGKDFVKPGMYAFEMTLTDAAGNQHSVSYDEIAVVDKETKLSLRCEKTYFSVQTGIRCRPEPFPEDLRFLRDWQKKIPVREWKAEITSVPSGKIVRSYFGRGGAPESLFWDGRDFSFRVLADGIYRMTFKAMTDNGEITTPERTVYLDNTAPSVSLVPSAEIFKGEEPVRFRIRTSESGKIASWLLQIYLLNQENGYDRRMLYRTFSGSGSVPDVIEWAGDTENRVQAESGEIYQAELTVTDAAGNMSATLSDNIRTDIIFRTIRPDAADLRMLMYSEGLYSEDDSLTEEGNKTLKRIADSLLPYPGYRISITTGLAVRPRLSSKEALVKTEKQAFAVYDYLKKAGIPSSRLIYRGVGYTEPADKIYPGRNSRIQIDLIP